MKITYEIRDKFNESRFYTRSGEAARVAIDHIQNKGFLLMAGNIVPLNNGAVCIVHSIREC